MGSAQVSPRIRPAARVVVFSSPSMLERKLQAFDFDVRKEGARRELVWDEPISETTTPAMPEGA